MPNDDLFIDVLAQIERTPARWDQANWAKRTACGTAYCFAGWAVALSGYKLQWVRGGEFTTDMISFRVDDDTPIEDVACELLGVSPGAAHSLFHSANTLDILYVKVAEALGLDRTVLEDKVTDRAASHS